MTQETMQNNIVEVRQLSRRFKRCTALSEVSLDIPKGGVFGLVGENGAGKTTLIKHILGLYYAEEGSVRVFGNDPVGNPEQVLAHIGYLSEDRDIPGWMKIHELMSYTEAFYPKWDRNFAKELLDLFELDPQARISTLSRGQLAKAGLLAALAHRPDLLVLDEPSSGLDPLVRRDILGAVIRTVADEGRTVLFSSHLLDEVERVADRVGMIYHGQLVVNEPMDTLRNSHHRLVVRTPASIGTSIFGEALTVHSEGDEHTVVCDGQLETLKKRISECEGEILEERSPSLEDIFVARAQSTTPVEG